MTYMQLIWTQILTETPLWLSIAMQSITLKFSNLKYCFIWLTFEGQGFWVGSFGKSSVGISQVVFIRYLLGFCYHTDWMLQGDSVGWHVMLTVGWELSCGC